MAFSQGHCPECNGENFKRHTGYILKNGESREIFYCWDCDSYFSETKNTPLAGLKTLVSRMALILEAINDGLGLNAACRTFHVGKHSLKRWVSRFIWELKSGPRETDLFQQAMETLAQVIVQTDDLTLVTDGERRYGNLLFDICQETMRTGQVARPQKH